MSEDIEDYQSICRTCLSEKNNLKDIFNIADILMSCIPIHVEEGDGLPTFICLECENKLNIVHDFRLLCIRSDEVLRKSRIKHEDSIFIKNDTYDNNDDLEDRSSENSVSPDLKLDENFVPLDIDEIDEQNLLDRQNKIIKRKTRHKKPTPRNCKNPNIIYNEKTIDYDDKIKSSEDESSDSDLEKNGKEMQCKYCDMKFRYRVRLKNHEQKHLHGLKCHLCNKDFSTLKQLTNHINIHSRKGAHLCQTCGKQFTLPENLVRHQRIHNGIRPYKCHMCNKSFTQSNELKSHIVTHTAEKNHLCSICGNKYSRSISLRVHMRRMHSIPPNHRPYICSVCGRNFKDRRDLSQHMQIHTGERSHICKVCNKAFNRSSNLRVHERIHTGQKPHACPVCHRAFIQKHVLITHMRTHPHNPPPVEVKMVICDAKNEMKTE